MINAATAISSQPTPATQTLCLNGSATALTVSASGTGTLTYQWYSNTVNNNSGGTIISGATASSQTPSSVSAGTTYYYAIVSGTCGNVISGTATVIVNAKSANPVSATASATEICVGSSTVLTLNGGGGGTGAILTWYSGSCGGTLVGTGNNLAVTPSTTTTYFGRYEDASPCNTFTACASVNITVNALPTVASITGPTYVGAGRSISLQNATTGGIWSIDNTAYATLSSTTGNPVVVHGSAVGLPTVTYTVTNNATGCSNNVSSLIHVYDTRLALYITKQNGSYSQFPTWNINRGDGNGPVPADTPPGNDDNITVKDSLFLDQDYNGDSNATFLMITGGTLIIQPNQSFNTAGSADFGDRPVIVQSTPAGSGAIGHITNGNGQIANATQVTVERFIGLNNQSSSRSGRAWRLLTAPVSNTTIGASWQEGILYDGKHHHPAGDTSTIVVPPAGYGTNITGTAQYTAANANGHGYDFWNDIARGSSSIRNYTHTAGSGSWNSLATIRNTDISSQPAFMLFVRGDKSKLSPPAAGATTLRATGVLNQVAKSYPVAGISTGAYTLAGQSFCFRH